VLAQPVEPCRSGSERA